MTSIPAAICRIFINNFKRFYRKNARLFLDILLHFINVHKICDIWKKTMSFLALLYPKLLFPKEVATETPRKSCFRTSFGNRRINWYQTQLKVARHHYYPFSSWNPGKLSWKNTALLWSKILRLFANTFTADGKYSCRNMQNFWQQFQTLLSQKQKTLSGFFLHFWNVHEIYYILKKRMSVLA